MGKLSIPLLAILLLAPAAGAVPDYFPWQPDAEWSYRDDQGGTLTIRVAAVRPDGEGGLWADLKIGVDGPPDPLRTFFWRRDAAGSLFDVGEKYGTPPAGSSCSSTGDRVVEAPLVAGRTWTSEFRTTCIVWSTGVGISFGLTSSYQVIAEEDLDLPAGRLHAFCVDFAPPAAKMLPVWPIWWCDGVGPVRLGAYELVSCSALVPARPASWGRVKALYR
jgi:hypothetical protein